MRPAAQPVGARLLASLAQGAAAGARIDREDGRRELRIVLVPDDQRDAARRLLRPTVSRRGRRRRWRQNAPRAGQKASRGATRRAGHLIGGARR